MVTSTRTSSRIGPITFNFVTADPFKLRSNRSTNRT